MSAYHINRYNRLKEKVDRVVQDMTVMVDGCAPSSPSLVKMWMTILTSTATAESEVAEPDFGNWEDELNRILKGEGE